MSSLVYDIQMIWSCCSTVHHNEAWQNSYGSWITMEALHQGSPCWVFSSFQLSSALICKHGRSRQPKNNTVFGFIRNPLSWICCRVCLTTVLWFYQPGVPKCSVSLWFLIFQSLVDRFPLFPVMGYWRRLSYLQLYCDRSTPGQVWQVSSWQGWMEHLISTCCTAKAAHQQLGVISYSHLSVSMVDLKTGLILHTHICMNKSGFPILQLASPRLWPLTFTTKARRDMQKIPLTENTNTSRHPLHTDFYTASPEKYLLSLPLTVTLHFL